MNALHALPAPLNTPQFWRDPALPFIEARAIEDGRKVCYARHAHETFSIGAVTAGQSTYVNGKTEQRISAGSVVLMNPGDVHACNPLDDQPWAYVMFYVDARWLGELQRDLGRNPAGIFQPIEVMETRHAGLFAGLNGLWALLNDPRADTLQKQSAVVSYFTRLLLTLNPAPAQEKPISPRLEKAAAYITEHCTRGLRLEDICSAANLSASYLIRAFEQHYGMTPHAFLINRRIQFARTQLKKGQLIADVALQAGFADQAHFQRAFKKYLAATPGQYLQPSTR